MIPTLKQLNEMYADRSWVSRSIDERASAWYVRKILRLEEAPKSKAHKFVVVYANVSVALSKNPSISSTMTTSNIALLMKDAEDIKNFMEGTDVQMKLIPSIDGDGVFQVALSSIMLTEAGLKRRFDDMFKAPESPKPPKKKTAKKFDFKKLFKKDGKKKKS